MSLAASFPRLTRVNFCSGIAHDCWISLALEVRSNLTKEILNSPILFDLKRPIVIIIMCWLLLLRLLHWLVRLCSSVHICLVILLFSILGARCDWRDLRFRLHFCLLLYRCGRIVCLAVIAALC